MTIVFQDNKLFKYANDDKLAIKKLGSVQAKFFKRRLDDLKALDSLGEAVNLPGNFHVLTSNRERQWACSLDSNYRLVFEADVECVPTDKKGNYDWSQVAGVIIIEIVDYHK